MDRSRYDSAMFWLPFGTAATVIGLALMTIGVTRMRAAENLLDSAWFDVGLGILAVGAVLLLWSLWLFLTHRRVQATASPTSSPSGSEPPAASAEAEAEAVRAYYREREKMLDKGMQVWEHQEREKRRRRKR